MSTSERRKLIFSAIFHIIAITCVVWSMYVLIDRTAQELRTGKMTSLLLTCGCLNMLFVCLAAAPSLEEIVSLTGSLSFLFCS